MRLSVIQKIIVTLVIVLLGMFSMVSVAINYSNQINSQQQTVDLLTAQRDSLYQLQILVEQSAKLLYRVVYAGHNEDVALLLAINENVLSVFEDFRRDADSLAQIGLPQNSYFAVENERLILMMRNELYHSATHLGPDHIDGGKSHVDDVMNSRIKQINTFIEKTKDLLLFQVSDAQKKLTQTRIRGRRSLIVIFLFIAALAIGSIILIGRSISKPLKSLTTTIQAISQTDDLNLRAKIISSDEIGLLAEQFNRLLDKLNLSSNERAEAYVKLNKSLSQLELESKTREALLIELTHKNTELEQFTYTVSHDLKSPLVTVNGFIGLLMLDIEKGDKERIQSDVKHIKDATHKMGSLLDNLLELSRIGRVVNAPSDFKLEDVVNSVMKSMRTQILDSGAELIIMPNLPIMHADKRRFEEVMENLLNNAIKFSSKDRQPQVKISAHIKEQDHIVCVADNGIGIDPRYHEKIFGLFDRLDTNFEGTGIGLALVKRIIEVHGGKVWVESEGPGYGSQFYFSIPKNT